MLTLESIHFQIKTIKNNKKKEKLHYPRFSKLIIDHFLSQNNNIAKRFNAVMHSELQDEVLSKLRVATKGETKYGMKIHDVILNDMIRPSDPYKKKQHITFEDNIVQYEDEATRLVVLVNVEEEIKMREELMAKEQHTSLLNGMEVDALILTETRGSRLERELHESLGGIGGSSAVMSNTQELRDVHSNSTHNASWISGDDGSNGEKDKTGNFKIHIHATKDKTTPSKQLSPSSTISS
ncbi:hypothetical protein Tco_0697570 [Tanacetum coccineum]